MHRGGIARTLGGVLGTALLLAGCASAPSGPREAGPSGDAIATGGCAAVAPEPWTGDAFEPVAVLACDDLASVDDAAGTWSALVLRTLVGDLEAVRAADGAPDDPPSTGPCTADMVIEPARWLVDGGGRGIAIREPRDGCGKPKGAAVGLAVQRLEEVERDEVRLRLIESAEAAAARCATWHAPLRLATGAGFDGVGPRDLPSEVVELPASPPSSTGPSLTVPGDALPAEQGLRLCRYRVGAAPQGDAPAPPDASGGLFFTGSETLEPATARELLELVARDRSTAPAACTASASHAVQLVDAAGTALAVELDGCRAIGVTGGAASEELLARLG